MGAYAEDLAYIHDAGFGGFAQAAGPALAALLREHGLEGGRVVELGCGSGVTSRALARAGYDVLGVDQSRAMVALARKRAPGATFRVGSFLDVELPRCVAVTAIGECFNYVFDPKNRRGALPRLFRRIHAALEPGGLLVFDVAEPGRVPIAGRGFRQGDDWAVLVEHETDARRGLLTRRMTTFRKVGRAYRRGSEVHVQRLLRGGEVAAELRRAGFAVRRVRAYGALTFPKGLAGFVARRRS